MQFQSRSLIKLFFISVCLPLFLFPGFIFADSTPGLESVYGDLQKPPANVVLILFDWARRDAIGVYGEGCFNSEYRQTGKKGSAL